MEVLIKILKNSAEIPEKNPEKILNFLLLGRISAIIFGGIPEGILSLKELHEKLRRVIPQKTPLRNSSLTSFDITMTALLGL